MMPLVSNTCDDSDLLRLHTSRRSEEAFAELVRRHIALVHSAALRQVGGNAAAAADITQAVFIELARHADRLAQHPALIGWLYTTTHRMAAHFIRDESRRIQREQEAHAMQELHRFDHESEAGWDRIQPMIDAAMHDLGNTDRLAILLRFFERRSYIEVGARLGLSENTARMRVERALDKLREKLEARGVTSTACALAAALAGPAVAAAPPALINTVTSAVIASVAAPISFSIPALMTLTKLKIVSLVATLVAAGTIMVGQYQTANGLQAANGDLQMRIDQLNKELQTARKAAEVINEELARLRESQKELIRLRGEVARFRVEEVKLAPDGRPSTKEIAQPAKITELEDVGTETPEHTSISLLWSITHQQKNRFIELVKFPEDVSPDQTNKLYEHLFRQFTGAYSNYQFSSILNTRTNEDGIVNIDFGYLRTGHEWPLAITLRKYDSEWKVFIDDVPKGSPGAAENEP